MRRALRLTAFLAVQLSLGFSVADAAVQAPVARFSLQGKVHDATRAPVAGAQVTAVDDSSGATVSTVADAQGEFTLWLDPGRYALTVIANGFSELSEILNASAGGTEARELVLQIAGIRETVTVNAAPGYQVPVITSATKTLTPLRDVPQSVTIVTQQLIKDQLMMSVGDVMRYIPGITVHQGENNRDQIIVRGNSSSADFFVNGVRDDVQYYRDLYNLDRVEALKGPNAMIFGRGGAGGVVNRVTKEAGPTVHEVALQGGMFGNKRFTTDLGVPLGGQVAFRLNGMLENSDSFRNFVDLERSGLTPTLTFTPSNQTRVTASYEYLNDRRVADRGITSFQGAPADVDLGTYYGDPNNSHVKANVNLGSAMIEHRMGRLAVRNHTLFGDYDRFYQNFVPGATSPDGSQVTLTAYNNATKRKNLFNQTDLDLCGFDRLGSPHPAVRCGVGSSTHGQFPEHRLLQQHDDFGCSCPLKIRPSARP